MGQLPRLGKRELICLLLFTCNYVVSVWRGFLFLWVLGMGYVIMPPTLKKLMGHIAFGASVSAWVRGCVRASHFLYPL